MGLLGLPFAHDGTLSSLLAPLLLLLLALATPVRAIEAAGLQIYNVSDKYEYAGCWNETTELPDTTRRRALDGGAQEVREGTMTPALCLGFCSSDGKAYTYAGLEYSRECWCANELSVLSKRLPDSYCNQTCDGAPDLACGGSLKLTVYKAKSDAARRMYAYSGAGIVAGSFVLALFMM